MHLLKWLAKVSLVLIVGGIGTYLWSVPSRKLTEHMTRALAWLRSIQNKSD
jgi:hypothetical protein